MDNQKCDMCFQTTEGPHYTSVCGGHEYKLCMSCHDQCMKEKALQEVQPSVNALFRIINGGDSGYAVEAFINAVRRNHPTMQQDFMRWLVSLMEHYADLSEGDYDLRLEDTVAMCKKLRSFLKDCCLPRY